MIYLTIAAITGTVILSIVYTYIFISDRKSYILLWTLSWIGSLITQFCVLWTLYQKNMAPVILGRIFIFADGLILVVGSLIFLGVKISKFWVCGFGITLVWHILGPSFAISASVSSIPLYLINGAIFFWAGWKFITARNIKGLDKFIVGLAFMVWGVQQGLYPWYHQADLLYAWEQLLVCLVGLFITFDLLVIYFHKVREDLSKKEERFRLLAENAQDFIYRYQLIPDLKFDYVSPAAASLTGYTPEEFYNEPDLYVKLGHPEAEQFMPKDQYVDSSSFIINLARKDGKGIWVEMHNTIIYDKFGKPVAVEGIARDVTERIRAEEQLRYLSMHDQLTGIYNRTFFQQEIRRLENFKYESIGIIVCDVDGLKLVNDTMGHDKGDLLLIAAARAIEKPFRKGEVAARIGGDEFAILLPNCNSELITGVIGEIRTEVNGYNETNNDLPLSMSVGFSIGKGMTKEIMEIFKEADNNMYREKLTHGQSARSAIVHTLTKTLEARDFITEGHAERLMDLVSNMGEAIGLSAREIADLRLLAQFHDLGKVGIPDRILFKNGQLTPEEISEMQRHSEIGYRIALSSPDLASIADWILKHHEWWNGGGYPFAIKGDDIPLQCRILGIADAFDAMTNSRPYRKSMAKTEALAELQRCSGTQFDPRLVSIFLQIVN